MREHSSAYPTLFESTPIIPANATMDLSDPQEIHDLIREANTTEFNALGINMSPQTIYADDTIVSVTPINNTPSAGPSNDTGTLVPLRSSSPASDTSSELFDASDYMHFNDHLGRDPEPDPMLGDSPSFSRFSPRDLPDVLIDIMDGFDDPPLISSGSHIRTRLFLRSQEPTTDSTEGELYHDDSLPDLGDLIELL
jgi:hypothetical protein